MFKYNVHNGAFIGAGLAIGVLSAIWNNQIEWGDNKEENKMYEDIVKEIIKSRRDNKKNITVIANTL